jgi:hypothetical protein
MQFMDNVDQRLSNLETVTREFSKQQLESPQSIPISTFELETAKRMQEQLEADMEAARKLQADFDTEYSKGSSTSSPSRNTQECPICHLKMSADELQVHIEPCLDKESKKDGPKKARNC